MVLQEKICREVEDMIAGIATALMDTTAGVLVHTAVVGQSLHVEIEAPKKTGGQLIGKDGAIRNAVWVLVNRAARRHGLERGGSLVIVDLEPSANGAHARRV